MKNFYKMMFIIPLMMSTIIVASSYNLFSAWMGLEINLLSIIPLMYSKNNILSSESSIKYFIVQASASAIFLASLIMSSCKLMLNPLMMENLNLMVMISAIFTKMGMAPFHFWMPEIIEGQSWNNTLIILTWQKIAPMILLMMMSINMIIMQIISISAMIFSSIPSMNQKMMKKILVFSSINHMGWMLPSMIMEYNVWIVYFLIYSFMTMTVIMFLKNFNIINFIQMINMKMSNSNKFMFALSFFSFSGVPPFIGFLPKWLTIQIMIESNLLLSTIIMIILTILMIFIYMRMTFALVVIDQNKFNWEKEKKLSMFSTSMMNFSMVISLMIFTIVLNL